MTPNTLWPGIRATLFWAGFAISTMFYGLITPILFLIPERFVYPILLTWAYFNLWWLKITCGVRYAVRNPHNIRQKTPHIVLSNHQSTFETLALPALFPHFSWVLKKELFMIPFFGWALKRVKPIGIDRSAGRSAVEQVKQLGKQRLDQGYWVCMFPEGTRVAPGKKARYKLGGTILATYSGYPVIPVAHNAGESWPRRSYIKKPGTITISVGEPIPAAGRKPDVLMKEVQQWIENEKASLPPVA